MLLPPQESLNVGLYGKYSSYPPRLRLREEALMTLKARPVLPSIPAYKSCSKQMIAMGVEEAVDNSCSRQIQKSTAP